MKKSTVIAGVGENSDSFILYSKRALKLFNGNTNVYCLQKSIKVLKGDTKSEMYRKMNTSKRHTVLTGIYTVTRHSVFQAYTGNRDTLEIGIHWKAAYTVNRHTLVTGIHWQQAYACNRHTPATDIHRQQVYTGNRHTVAKGKRILKYLRNSGKKTEHDKMGNIKCRHVRCICNLCIYINFSCNLSKHQL